jgi:hypothetical protein
LRRLLKKDVLCTFIRAATLSLTFALTSGVIMAAASGSNQSKGLEDYAIGYAKIKLGLAVLGIVFPFFFIVPGWFSTNFPTYDSISAYYHLEYDSEVERNPAAKQWQRDVFVATLVTVGFILFLYEGYGRWENYLLSVAGLCATIVAFFPTRWYTFTIVGITATPHDIAAMLLFVLIAFVATFYADTTLQGRSRNQHFYKNLYIGVSVIMLAALFVAVLWHVSPYIKNLLGSRVIFWVEATCIWSFALYWFVKTVELHPGRLDGRVSNLLNRLGILVSRRPSEPNG